MTHDAFIKTDYEQLMKETRMLFDFELPSKPYSFATDVPLIQGKYPEDVTFQNNGVVVPLKKANKLSKVIVGHDGWVRSICMDPYNKFFASGSVDKLIKIWTMGGQLNLTLTGHLAAIRDLCISKQNPYLYSASEDKTIFCWDLTQNKAIRKYHGHLHGVYCMALDDSGLWMASGGRDSCCRIWDVRTRKQELVLTGFDSTVSSVLINDNHIIAGSMDSTIRIFDKRNGDMIQGLTLHIKGVRSMVKHPILNCFFSASADGIKAWKLDDYSLFCDLDGFETGIVHSLACNDTTLVAGNDTGLLQYFDTDLMSRSNSVQSLPQPGSLTSEASILKCCFHKNILYTGEVDKTIKVWK